jgi:RNA recognition motif-containing protein
LVVRNTFLEFVPKTALRSRALSDSCLSSLLEGKEEELRKSSVDDISDVSTNTPAEEVDQSLEDGTNASALGDDSSCSGDSIDHFQQVTAPQSAMIPCPGTFWIPMQATVPGWCVVPCPPRDNSQQCWTTVMLKNIPNDYTQEMLLKLLDEEGFSCKYDFVYLPMDFRSGSAFGYAFINLVTPADTKVFESHFHGFCRWAFPSRKVAEVTWSRPMQGLAATIERYRNSPIMHQDVPDCYKPIIFQNGARVAFPLPTKPVSLPEEIVGPQIAASAAVRSPQSTCNAWRSDKNEFQSSERTTLMLRNLPNDYNRSMLLSLLDEEGFAGKYDFVYLPIDFASGAGVGYAFINMVSHQDAERFRVHFTGFTKWAFPSRKVAEVAWSNPNQGLAVHIERYRNSTVMHPSVCDDFKPALFANGVRVPFPLPTRIIKAPQL